MFEQAKLQGIEMPVEKPEDLRPLLLNIKKDIVIVRTFIQNCCLPLLLYFLANLGEERCELASI